MHLSEGDLIIWPWMLALIWGTALILGNTLVRSPKTE